MPAPTLPILLLFCMVLWLWFLVKVEGHVFAKSLVIITMFAYGLVNWFVMPTFYGWGASPENLYGKPLTIYHAHVVEPTTEGSGDGGIFVEVSEPRTIYESWILRMFGHPVISGETRLHKFPYSRNLHKQVEGKMMPKFARNQSVQGKFSKGKGFGEGKEGDGEGEGNGLPGEGEGEGEGEGDESQDDGETHFHELQPSDIQPKAIPKLKPKKKGTFS